MTHDCVLLPRQRCAEPDIPMARTFRKYQISLPVSSLLPFDVYLDDVICSQSTGNETTIKKSQQKLKRKFHIL